MAVCAQFHPPAAALAIACTLPPRHPPSPPRRNKKPITCPLLKGGLVTFDIPAKLGGLPAAIDFDYEVTAKQLSLTDGNLFLLAMYETEPTRVRIMSWPNATKSPAPTTARFSSTWAATS